MKEDRNSQQIHSTSRCSECTSTMGQSRWCMAVEVPAAEGGGVVDVVEGR